MNVIDKDDLVDDGTVYIVKKGDEINLDKILDYPIDYDVLKRDYSFSLNDREIILRASLQLQSGEPDLEILKKAIALIESYKSAKLKKEQSHLRHAQKKDEEISCRIDNAYSSKKRVNSVHYAKNRKKVEVVFKTGEEKTILSSYLLFLKEEKKIWLAAVLAFFLNGFGLFYVSWMFAIGMLIFSISAYVSIPILLIASPFLSLGLAIYAAIETNNKLSSNTLPIQS